MSYSESAIFVTSMVLFAASGLVFDWGIPISAYCVYSLNKSRGWMLLAAGFGVRLGEEIIYSLSMWGAEMTGHYSPGNFWAIPHQVIHLSAMAVALVGFIMIVKCEEKKT